MRLDHKKELTPVIYGEAPVRVLSFRFRAGDRGFESHWHERMEFHLVRSGSLKLTCDEQMIMVYPGEVSIIAPGVSHGGLPGENGVVYDVVMFDIADLRNGSFFSGQYLEPILTGAVRFAAKTDLPAVVSLIEKIIETEHKQTLNPLETVGDLYRLLGLLWQTCAEDYAPKAQASNRIGEAIRYIDAHFTDDLTVSSVCETFGYTEGYFCRQFKKATGLTAANYIRICRLEEAKRRLEKTNDSVKRIALSCGFSVPSYFINCFRNAYGISPAKYRVKYHNPGCHSATSQVAKNE